MRCRGGSSPSAAAFQNRAERGAPPAAAIEFRGGAKGVHPPRPMPRDIHAQVKRSMPPLPEAGTLDSLHSTCETFEAFVASTRRSPRRQIFLEFEELPDFAIGKLAGFFDILLRIDFPYRNIIFRLRGTGDRLLADIRGLLRTVAPKVLWCLCILAELRLSWRNTGRPRLGLVDYIQLGSVSVCEFCHGRCLHSYTAPDVPVSQG